MIQFKNVKIRKQEILESVDGELYPVIYFEDELGRDWYTLRDEVWTGETAFICVDSEGFIITGATDPNFMTVSEGISIYEISTSLLPADVGQSCYRYEKGQIIAYEPPASEVAAAQKAELMKTAAEAMAPLQDAVDMGIATDEEKAQLIEWKKYRVLVNRIDTSLAPDIEWPVPPNAN